MITFLPRENTGLCSSQTGSFFSILNPLWPCYFYCAIFRKCIECGESFIPYSKLILILTTISVGARIYR